jgi:hypothetical protein
LVDKNPTTYAAPGDFGGIVLIGNAPSNRPAGTTIEGVPTTGGFDNTYGGGTTSNDNSGKMAPKKSDTAVANHNSKQNCTVYSKLVYINFYLMKSNIFSFFFVKLKVLILNRRQ